MEILVQIPKQEASFINIQNELNNSAVQAVEKDEVILDSKLIINSVINQYNDVATIFDAFPIAAKDDVQLFIDRIPSNQKTNALDLGCGTGRTVFELSKHFKNVIGVDISDSMVEFAQQKCQNKCNTTFFNNDIRKLNLKPNSFDYIVSHTTFHHLDKDLNLTLEKVKTLLRPNGKIVIIDILAKGLMKKNAPLVRKIGASITLIQELPKLGFKKAWANFMNATNASWMEHLKMDRFLSEKEFKEEFGYIFQGAEFNEFTMEYGLNHLILMEWTKSE